MGGDFVRRRVWSRRRQRTAAAGRTQPGVAPHPAERAGQGPRRHASRGHIYVTVPSRDELLVISASTLEVLRRIHLGSRPSGLSVSPDEDEIFVGLAASGAIAILDADSFSETRIFVATELESSEVYKVVETEPGILYVSTGIPNSEGRIARVDRSSGVVTAIAATGFNEIELLADPARNLLYASDGIPAAEPTVRKLDAGAPGTPQPSAFVQTTGPGQFNRRASVLQGY